MVAITIHPVRLTQTTPIPQPTILTPEKQFMTSVNSTVVILDRQIENAAQLAAGLSDCQTWVMLDQNRQGLAQVTQAIQQFQPTQLYLLAHGSPGCLHLGNQTLNAANLADYASLLRQWFPQGSASIHFYACRLADSAAGVAFLQQFHELTGAKLAASTQPLGRTEAGVNWRLDYQIGAVDGLLPIHPDSLAAYQGQLAAPSITDIATLPRTTPEDMPYPITGISISDPDGGTQTVTVSVTSGRLTLASTANLTVSNNGTGTVTLSGAIADVNAALEGMAYVPNLNSNSADILSISVNDGTQTVNRDIGITVTPVNDAPTFANLGGSIGFTENGTAVVLDGNVTVNDIELGGLDNWNNAQLMLRRSSGANSQDVFSNSGTLATLTQGGNLVVNGTTIGTVTTNSGGTLLLTFNTSATTALVNQAIQQITYSNSSEDPPASVNISYTLNDRNSGSQGSGGELTATGTVTINTTPINDAPVLTAGATLAYTENQTARVIDNTIALSDVDDTQIASATVTISGGFTAGDILATTTVGNITANYNTATGQLTLSGLDTLANYRQVMRSVTYRSSSETPTQTAATRTITWRVTDSNSDGAGAQTSSATSLITVNALPDPVSDSFTTSEDTTVSGSVADADPGDGVGTYSLTTLPTRGAVLLSPDGSFTYRPGGDFNGTDSFVYTVTDSNGDARTATATITVTSAQDIASDTATVKEDSLVNVNVLANDAFRPGAAVTGVTQGANGSVAINPDGTVRYQPNANFFGIDAFTYTVTSGGVTETGTVTVTVDAVPDAVDDNFTVNEDILLIGTIADADPGNPTATYTVQSAPNHGTLTLNSDGMFTYTPNPDFNGSDSFVYTVTDDNGDTDTGNATITVTPVRDTQNDAGTTPEDTAIDINVLANDSFRPGAVVTGVTQGANGTVVINPDGTVKYTPRGDFNGSDSFTYTVTAGGVTETAMVNVAVNPVQDVQNDLAITNEDTLIDINVLANDSFRPGAVVTAVTQGTNGSVVINPDGTVKYTPRGDFNGSDSFTYTVTSGSVTETATVNVDVSPVRDIQNDLATTSEDTAIDMNVLANDSFRPGAVVIAVTQGSSGTVSINPDGTVKYISRADFDGTDSFTYSVSAGGSIETATVNVTVNPVQDVQSDLATTNEDIPIDINVLNNDSFRPGATVTDVTQGANGAVVINPGGTVQYRPNADFNGSDSFTYTVTTAAGNTETATVNVIVGSVQDIQNDAATTNEDTEIDINVFANDSFGPGATVTSVTQGTNGSVIVNPNGTVKYSPRANFNGSDSFTYTVTAGGNTETATVNFTVNPVQDIQDDSATTNEDTAVDINVLVNDSFGAGAVVTGVTQGANGTVVITPDGTVKYRPNADFNGSDFFTYTVTAGGVTETATVNVTVNPVQDIQNDLATTNEDTAIDTNVLNNDTFQPGATVTGVTQGANGAVAINADGTVKYTPKADFNGSDAFTYTITTAAGNTETATVNVTVGSVQDIQNDAATTDEDRAIDIDLLANDSFQPGAAITSITQGSHGTVALNSNGTVKYTPNADFQGSDIFTYEVTAGGVTETATVNVTINPAKDIQNDAATTDEDTAIDIAVLNNDAFQPGATVTGVTQGANGAVVVNANGTVKYTPEADFNGTDSFTYTITTAAGNTETATVNVIIDPVKDVQDDSATTDEDNAVDIDVLSNDGFELGAVVTDMTQGTNGTVVINGDGTIKYRPNADFHGVDSFTYTVTAGGVAETATVNVTVNPVQDIQDELVTTDEDNAVTIDVLNNDSFAPGALVSAVTQGQSGTVTIGADGSVNYRPQADFHGSDSFTYTVLSGDLLETGIVNVTVNSVRDAIDEQRTTLENRPITVDVLANDAFSGLATVTELSQGQHGAAVINADGTVTYSPNRDYRGIDKFTYTVTTAAGNQETATVTIEVNPDSQNRSATPDFLAPVQQGKDSQRRGRAIGTEDDDMLNGFSNVDILDGMEGNDIINGGSGEDSLLGGSGNDTLNGGTDNDYMEGGTGQDILNGGSGNNRMLGNAGNDVLNGGRDRDHLSGGRGNDVITGNGQSDRLYGDEDNDRLIGNRGNDRLVGGLGKDRMTGGQGRDQFVYTSLQDGGDVITDFEVVNDRFNLTLLFQGSRGSLEDLRFKQRGDNTLIQVNSGSGWRNLALLQDVNADTLDGRHFTF